MRLLRWPTALLVALCVVLPARASLAQVEQHALYVGVVDSKGRPVTNLTADDFVVREDRFTREVLRAYRATEPMDIALLVDNSHAFSAHVGDLRRAVTAFVRALHENNPIALVALASRPTILVDYTRDLARLNAGVQRIFPESGTGATLMDGIRETSLGLVKRDPRRPVMVVITALGPEMSDRNDHREVLEALERTGATLHAFILTSGGGSRTDRRGIERELTLSRGTSETGGRQEEMATSSSLNARLTQLAEELLHQYRVVYARPQELIPPDSIKVSVRRPGLTARGIPERKPNE